MKDYLKCVLLVFGGLCFTVLTAVITEVSFAFIATISAVSVQIALVALFLLLLSLVFAGIIVALW
ncbi:MAG: hypothetical protein J6T08_08860 [Lentisphaeria bacterium]|nr:hypothetical protein [Lentisphaeria bacterium]